MLIKCKQIADKAKQIPNKGKQIANKGKQIADKIKQIADNQQTATILKLMVHWYLWYWSNYQLVHHHNEWKVVFCPKISSMNEWHPRWFVPFALDHPDQWQFHGLFQCNPKSLEKIKQLSVQ